MCSNKEQFHYQEDQCLGPLQVTAQYWWELLHLTWNLKGRNRCVKLCKPRGRQHDQQDFYIEYWREFLVLCLGYRYNCIFCLSYLIWWPLFREETVGKPVVWRCSWSLFLVVILFMAIWQKNYRTAFQTNKNLTWISFYWSTDWSSIGHRQASLEWASRLILCVGAKNKIQLTPKISPFFVVQYTYITRVVYVRAN